MSWKAIRKGLGLPETGAAGGEGTDVEVGAEWAPVPQQVAGAPATAGQAALDYQLAPDDGVLVDPVPITEGQTVHVSYSGLLAKAGADAIYLHCGFGPGPWRKVRDAPMRRVGPQRWEASVAVDQGGTFEFCFRDGAYNWDNNKARNWSYTVHGGRTHH